ncbi:MULTISPECIES: hypothetical protein [Rhizobium/Agrobacterium group]|uniref:hypothetical protein n=1 Tax=Rhizobium/Agrobacterium group TaxID=227290 RepID=UPI000B3F8129|nr:MULTISPECIES: hypothetical protein [Rhizobium/Agrobacterium group]NSZ41600.1 hypothetical protein [Agrobacterium vitis]NTA25283.1 hypothetical protein [Allorhizobium ampelinum]OVE97415.1 hypothetical protein B7W85_02065 [Allorhizobium ampelinum]
MCSDVSIEKLSLFRGLSIFYPSDEFINIFREKWKLRTEFLSNDEKIVWIGSPDFRFSLISFGPGVIHFYFITCVILALYLNIFKDIKGIFMINLVFLLTFFLLISMLISIARRFFGIVYCLTDKRLCVLYCYGVKDIFGFEFKNSINMKFDGYVYFDLKTLTDVNCIKLLNYDFGSVFFGGSIQEFPAGKLKISKNSTGQIKKISFSVNIILQKFYFGYSTITKLVAIHKFSKFVSIFDELRQLRSQSDEEILLRTFEAN